MVTLVGSPPLGKRVTVVTSTPPWDPEFGPPRGQKLSKPVAFQVPKLRGDPDELKMVNEPLATTVLVLGSKLPAPVSATVWSVLGSLVITTVYRGNCARQYFRL
jgi:hypothetical protein